MDVHGALEKCVRLIRKHECPENLHELAAFRGKDEGAEDAVVRSINNELHQARGFAALDGTRHTRHWAFPNLQFVAFRARFLFRYADDAELRIRENAIRHDAVFNREIFSFNEIAVNNLKIVVGNVREGRTSLAISQRPDAGNICFEAAIHFDKSIFVRDDAGFVEAEVACVWTATSGSQEMGAADARHVCRSLVGKRNSGGSPFDT